MSIELTQNLKKRLKNDVLDMHYLTLGVLQRGFATNDNVLKNFIVYYVQMANY